MVERAAGSGLIRPGFDGGLHELRPVDRERAVGALGAILQGLDRTPGTAGELVLQDRTLGDLQLTHVEVGSLAPEWKSHSFPGAESGMVATDVDARVQRRVLR